MEQAEITAFDPRIKDMRSGSGLSCRTSDKPTCTNIRGCLKLRMRLVLPLVAENCKVQESEPLNQV